MHVMYENTTHLCHDSQYYKSTIGMVVEWLIFLIGLPLICLAGHALLNLLRKGQAAPVFVINLLITDLLQIAIKFIFIVSKFYNETFHPLLDARCISRLFVRMGLYAGLGFMLLISVERYLLVAYPLWYRNRNITKLCTLASICLWLLSLTYVTLDYVFLIKTRYSLLVFSSTFLLPAPFFVGFFVATWKALYSSMTLRKDVKKRRRVLWALGLVLGKYTVMFLPYSFRNLYYYSLSDDDTTKIDDQVRDLSAVLASALVYISPMIDPFLYIFMRRDIGETIEAFPCCRKILMKISDCQQSGVTERVTESQGVIASTDL